MSDEVQVIGILWKAGLAVMGIGGVIIGFFTKRAIKEVDNLSENVKKLEKSEAACKLDIANFRTEVSDYKTHVSENYAKDATIQHSLERVYAVMAQGFKDQREYFVDLLNAHHNKK